MEQQKPDENGAGKTRPNAGGSSKFLKYSGLAMQMLGTILVFTYGGYRLDAYQQNSVPVWTLVLSLTSIAGSLYMLIRSFSKS